MWTRKPASICIFLPSKFSALRSVMLTQTTQNMFNRFVKGKLRASKGVVVMEPGGSVCAPR